MRLLDGLLGIKRLSVNGTELPARQWWRILSGATAVDNPSNGSTDITIAGGGIELSDAPPSPTGPTSEAGVSPKAMRGDAVIAHGDQPGGSLHAVAVASVAGVGGSAGFASPVDKERTDQVPQMLLDIAALPSTYAPIVHTHAHNTLSGLTVGDPHTQYVLRTDGSSVANSNKWLIRNAQARAEAMGLTHTATTKLDVLGPGDLELIAGSNPALTEASALLRGRAGIKLQVNDATTPATVRTVLEVVREAGGAGTADAILVSGSLAASSASDPGKAMKWLAGGDFSLSTESVNADGRRYFEHGSDGASLSNSSLAIAPKTWTVAKGATLTIDCSMSNVHVVTVTDGTGDVTLALTNTRSGAEYTILIGQDGGDYTANIALASGSFDPKYGPFAPLLPTGSVGPTTSAHIRCMATVDAGKAYILSAVGFA